MNTGKTCSLFFLGSVVAVLLAGCSGGANNSEGGGGGTPLPTPSITSVTVSCSARAVPTTQTTQCAATVSGTGSYNSSVAWSVNNVAGGNSTVGSISSTGTYTAPATVPSPYTTTISATSVADTTKAASVPIIVAGTIASASQTISAASGGTITLPDGSSVTISPNVLSSDQSATLSEVSYLSTQPQNAAIQGVGPGLLLAFSSPIPPKAAIRRAAPSSLRTMHPDAQNSAPVAFQFSIRTTNDTQSSMNGSVPAADFIDTSGVSSFMGTSGNYDSTTGVVTDTIGIDQWNALLSTVRNDVQSIAVTAVTIIGHEANVGLNLISTPSQLSLSTSPNDAWTNYTQCPTGKTLLVVHGMNDYIEDAFPTASSTTPDTIGKILSAGNYQNAVGFDYNWTQSIVTSGGQLATFLNTLTQCPGISLDIEAHSEGVPVTMSALNQMNSNGRPVIKRFIALGGPIMGTPMATDGRVLATFLMGQAALDLGSNVVVDGLAALLNSPFVADLTPSKPGDGSTLDSIRTQLIPGSLINSPQIFVVAGDHPHSPVLMATASLLLADGVDYSDGFIPVASALAIQPKAGPTNVLKVYPLAPFPVEHTDLTSDSHVIASVGSQVSNAFVSPSLTISSPQCPSGLVCSSTPGTSFSLAGSGYSSQGNQEYRLLESGEWNSLSSFTSSDGSIPNNGWLDTPPCSTTPQSVAFFAENLTTQQVSNAVTEEIAGNCPPTPPTSGVSISPSSASLVEGGSQTFTASVSGGGGINWSILEGSSGGTIVSSGLSEVPPNGTAPSTFTANYFAPSSPGTFHVVATSTVDPSQSATATVSVTAPSANANEWTWMSGSNTAAEVGVYGAKGVAASTNVPGSRSGAVSWTDSNDNLWLFGGQGNDSIGASGPLNDLWEFNPNTQEWTWISGSNATDLSGVYGTLGVSSTTNMPGGRYLTSSWIDPNGNFWVFGGDGVDSTGFPGQLNDLWEFNPTSETWTWISGANTAGSSGVYGTLGTPAITNTPGSRSSSTSWIDSSGHLWLFGGNGTGIGLMNDLWRFDPSAKTWTWMGGSHVGGASGVYGTQGAAAAANIPGSRYNALGWTDKNGNFWLFGGQGMDITGAQGDLNDLWEFNPARNEWTWVSGADQRDAFGVYGTSGTPSAANVPGSRDLAIGWIDTSGDLWLFGGEGYGSNGIFDQLNDLWRYQP